MAPGIGYILLGVALLFGVACTLLYERIAEHIRDSRWLEARRNAQLGRKVIKEFRLEKEYQQQASSFRDPRIEAALQTGDEATARQLANEGLRRSFEGGNEDMQRLYRDYLAQIEAGADEPGP